ncbi:TlpA family protein disulfide reductase [Edaphobacter albus]|uniref:TlpA family protein disulfide reductase n=1 Tax=Edaphobacter sp. 4G125 TaxID=2763071 RepID=UPI001644DF58|nr:TlpA disulfide reductase family protein [Edaphobacter sp. 4G125]QNI35697.1 TlpA family protein disulfide reductase [Edaphobacter sp. 4G125]
MWIMWVNLALLLLTAGCDRGQHPERVNKVAPQFSISDGSQSVDLSKLRGKVVLLNFWASWCPPCIEELPTLMELHRRMPEVVIVAVSIDEDAEKYQKFLTKNHVDLLTVRDSSQRIETMYGTVQIPETYVIDREGMLRRKFVSAQNWTSPEIMDYLAKL